MNAEQKSLSDLGLDCLRRRSDLVFVPQKHGDETIYLVDDPLRSKFYRLGLAEYTFLSLLDGQTSLQDVVTNVQQVSTDARAFSVEKALRLVHWLRSTNLIHAVNANVVDSKQDTGQPNNVLRRLAWNPLIFRIPLFCPEQWLSRIGPWLQWLFSPLAFVTWTALMIYAGYVAAANWDRLMFSARGMLVPQNWIWTTIAWIVLKIVHELAHGVVCKKYGGYVGQCGILMILFLPVAFVDTTSSWKFRSKWQRIYTAAAGMYLELGLAAIAAIVWSRMEAGQASFLLVNCLVMAGATTLLFNANPLMRFDGYYILSDLLGIPNLYTDGQRYLKSLFGRFVFASPTGASQQATAVKPIVRTYAVASYFWRILVCAGLLLAASCMFGGAGLVLAVSTAVGWFLVPFIRFVNTVMQKNNQQTVRWFRLGIVTGSLALFITATFLWIPWPFRTAIPAIVQYAPLTTIRADSEGFICQVNVTSGQIVEAGEILAVMQNDELEKEVRELALELEKAHLVLRVYKNQQEVAAYQAELEHVASLEKRLGEKETQLEALTIKAPCAGQIIGRNLDTLIHTRLDEGDALLAIGDETAKELQLSVPQNKVDSVVASVGHDIIARVPSRGRLPVHLTQVEPQASRTPPDSSLCAPLGGSITVVPVEHRSDDKSESQAKYHFVEPRFTATASIAADQSTTVRAGQRVTVLLKLHDVTVGRYLSDAILDWARTKMDRGRDQTQFVEISS